MTHLWKGVRRCNVANRGHQKGKDQILTTIYDTDKLKEESEIISTHAIALSANVFLHVPSDPVRASSCVSLPGPNPMLSDGRYEIYT